MSTARNIGGDRVTMSGRGSLLAKLPALICQCKARQRMPR